MNEPTSKATIQIENNKTKSIVRLLFGYRIKNYFSQMKSFLMQYKQGVILLIVLLAPTLTGINYLLTKPLLTFITSNNPQQIFISSLFIYAIYTAWIIIQRAAIKPPASESYLATLPISKSVRQLINLSALFIANNVFLIPLIATIMNLIHADMVTLNQMLSAAFLITSIFSIEKNMLNGNAIGILLIIISSLLASYIPILLIGCIAIGLYTLLFNLKSKDFGINALLTRLLGNGSRGMRTALITRIVKTQTALRVIFSLAAMTVGASLINFSTLSSHIISTSLVTLGISSFIISGLFLYFHNERTKHITYLNSLPRSSRQWAIGDIRYTTSILTGADLIYFALILHTLSTHIIVMIALYVYQIILLGMIYAIRTRFAVLGTLLCCLTTALWIVLPIVIKGLL